MKIAIIGTGNVGGALATRWSKKGHAIRLGVQDTARFKGKDLLANENTAVLPMKDAVAASDVVLIATPPDAIVSILDRIGPVSGKVLIDATNAIRSAPAPYRTVYHCLADRTDAEVVKCFNSTGFENMLDPVYGGECIDMFMAGDSGKAKQVAAQLAADAGFGSCIDFGKADRVELLEQLALCWINLAIMQGMGRGIAFKLLRRA